MKRVLCFLFFSFFLFGCGKIEKPQSVVARHEMRTRTTDIPIDSAFSSKSIKYSFDVFSDINPKLLVTDLKDFEIDTISDESLTKQWVGNIKSLNESHSDCYQPGLTFYFIIVLALFIIILIVKCVRTFIIKK